MASTISCFTTAEMAAWESRADVLYHFYAYHYFDQGPRHAHSLDMVNLDDADVQFYNRTAHQTLIFSSQHKLAEFLSSPPSFKLPPTSNTKFGLSVLTKDAYLRTGVNEADLGQLSTRQCLVWHVRMYNLTQKPRRRFYLLGVTDDDLTFVRGLIADSEGAKMNDEKRGIDGWCDSVPEKRKELVFATDGCLGFPAAAENLESKDMVAVAAENLLMVRDSEKPKFSKEVNHEPNAK